MAAVPRADATTVGPADTAGTVTAADAGVELARRSIAVIRGLIIDTIESAGCGHPGAALALAPLGYSLYRHALRVNPLDPRWPDRDRFVLSAGHASALHYVLLHLAGYPVSVADLRAFRTVGSLTPGHPEFGVTPGVEATTGPLGQGIAAAVGMALAERLLAHHFNRPGHRIVDHRTVAVVSDGDLMEGVSQEAISLAGQLGLAKLVVCYDSNGVTIDGTTRQSFDVEDQEQRFRASGWNVERVSRFNDPVVLTAALGRAYASGNGRPSLLLVETEIGYPAEAVQGTPAAHGSPLGAEEAARTKARLGLPPTREFTVPADVSAHLDLRPDGQAAQDRWRREFAAWSAAHPELRRQWDGCHDTVADAIVDRIPEFRAGSQISPRNASREIMDALSASLPTMLGGAADLVDSTKTWLIGSGYFSAERPDRNIPFGVREHAMAGAVNGAALHGGIVKPYASTFLTFGDYMRPAVRLSALMRLPVLWIWTHDSIAIGSDGPTHQPVEQIAALRAMPNLWVLRPCDATETAEAWRLALRRDDGPVALVLARQNLPVLPETEERRIGIGRGGYVLWEPPERPRMLFVATGSEVHLALGAAKRLADRGLPVRVVSLPCWELFERQDDRYRESVLPSDVPRRLAVEAASPLGWHRWVGSGGRVVSMSGFGGSDQGDVLLRHFGFSVERLVAEARQMLDPDGSGRERPCPTP